LILAKATNPTKPSTMRGTRDRRLRMTCSKES
jgi:hypothetical protein